ncbi:acetyl-CoA carboxylase biotin carboxyl carrier protein [Micromonospora sp. NPDC049559]|uniref:acetyl-CoA carboxylase biotin carboxyl carrier protein n=1 Tax=Micromonospora sp. NPDC049559 TaxID=3155923 RepID=UPI003440E51E
MTSEAADGNPVLGQLREQLHQLVTEATGPLRRVRLRSGDTVLEVEWPYRAADSDPPPVDAAAPVPPPRTVASTVAGPEQRLILSPIVGTFYRSPEPGAAPFVEVGDVVEPGQVIGIVEAMKLMNQVTAEQAGKVAEVLANDGEPVEFQQPLIALVSG